MSDNNKLINIKNDLSNILNDLTDKTFNANDFFPGKNDLPPINQKEIVDYESLENIQLEKSKNFIESIVQNYVTNDDWRKSEKVQAIFEQQVSTLAELEFLVATSKESIMSAQMTLDSGDFHIEIFEIKKTFMQEMRSAMSERTKHIKEVEKYWETQATKYGIEDTKESIEITKNIDVKETNNNLKEEEDLKMVMDFTKMINMINTSKLEKSNEDNINNNSSTTNIK